MLALIAQTGLLVVVRSTGTLDFDHSPCRDAILLVTKPVTLGALAMNKILLIFIVGLGNRQISCWQRFDARTRT